MKSIFYTENYEDFTNISTKEYRLVDYLNDKFDISKKDEEDINNFIRLNNGYHNNLMNLIIDVYNKIKNINPEINISLKIHKAEYFIDEILKISPKIEDFNDVDKIEQLNDDLFDKYDIYLLDNIIISMEF